MFKKIKAFTRNYVVYPVISGAGFLYGIGLGIYWLITDKNFRNAAFGAVDPIVEQKFGETYYEVPDEEE